MSTNRNKELTDYIEENIRILKDKHTNTKSMIDGMMDNRGIEAMPALNTLSCFNHLADLEREYILYQALRKQIENRRF